MEMVFTNDLTAPLHESLKVFLFHNLVRRLARCIVDFRRRRLKRVMQCKKELEYILGGDNVK